MDNLIENSKWKSRKTGRELVVVGDDGGYRYFYFEDHPNILTTFSLTNKHWSWLEFAERI